MDVIGLFKAALELASKWSGYWIGKKDQERQDSQNPKKQLEKRQQETDKAISQGDEVSLNTRIDDILTRLRNDRVQGDKRGQGD